MTFKAMKFKVENPSHSEAIQRELFKQGYKWFLNDSFTVEEVNHPYLYAEDNGNIFHGSSSRKFIEDRNTLTTLEQLQEYTKMTAPKTPRTVPLHWPADEPFPYKHLEGRSVICTKSNGTFKFAVGKNYVVGFDRTSYFSPIDSDGDALSSNHSGRYAFDLILNDDEDGVPAAPEQRIRANDIETVTEDIRIAEDDTGTITVGFKTPATPDDLVAKAFNLISGYDLSSDDIALILQLAKRSR